MDIQSKVEEWKKRIYASFPAVTDEAWRDQITKDLKGADYNKKLVWRAYETIAVKPYYRLSDLPESCKSDPAVPGQFPYLRSTKTRNNDWQVREDIYSSDPKAAAHAARAAVAGGAASVGFITRYEKDHIKYTAIDSAEAMLTLIEGLDLEATAINFDAELQGPAVLDLFTEALQKKGILGQTVKGALDYDPISALCKYGFTMGDKKVISRRVAETVQRAKAAVPGFTPLTVQSSYFHDAGASAVEELAFTLSSAVEYLNLMTDAGIALDTAISSLSFKFSIGSNYFFEIAKLRAARKLYAKLIAAFGPLDQSLTAIRMTAQTGRWNKTLFDPHTNMLRTTTEAMAAALGGCDEIAVLPYDFLYAEPSDFSYRIARNTQLMLKHESGFDKVIDAAGGSYYLETLTEELLNKAYDLFMQCEEQGGFIAAFERGFIKDKIEAVRAQKLKNTQLRREVFLGTNQFPIVGERFHDQRNLLKVQASDPQSSFIKKLYPAFGPADPAVTLVYQRGAEEFEELRLATEALEKKRERTPTVSLISGGDLAMRIARATFVTNFFGCAGYRVHDNPPFSSFEEGVTLLKQQNPDIVVFCSSDDEYPALVSASREMAEAAARGAICIIAGNPQPHVETLRSLGVQDFVHIGTNAVEFFRNYQQKLG
jgi:methylmalonyl-CoA mutase